MKFIPHSYQTRMIQRTLNQNNVGLLLDCGLGKTVISLTAADVLMNEEFEVDRVLVITTKSARLSWMQEVKRWDHLSHLRVAVVEGSPAQREKILARDDVDIFIINRDLTSWISDFYIRQTTRPVRKTGRRVKVPDMLIIDELSSYKSAKTARFKALRRIRPLFSRVVGLTGTPNPNGYDDLWSQAYLLDQGKALLPTIRAYHDAYFHPGRGNGHIVYEWIPDKGAPELIMKRLEGLCVSMKAEDYLTLPDLIVDDIPVELSSAEMEKYKALERDKILALTDEQGGGAISTFQAATLAIKLMQLSGGSVYADDGSAVSFHSAKLDALEDIIESAGEDEPIMVMYAYKHELDRIWDRFREYGPRLIDGEKDVDDWNAGKIRLLLCHPQSVAHGMNLQYGPGHRVVWYTLTNSLELYDQANHRLYRQGHTRPVFIHRLIAQGKKLEQLLGERAVYQGMPSMAFKVGEYTVSKTGEVTPTPADEIVSALSAAGFSAEDAGGDAEEEQSVGITITIPTENLSDSAIVNFKNMTESKASLIEQAFGVRDLPIEVNENVLTVRWFEGVDSGNSQHAAAFVSAMLEKAGQQRYVNPRPLETDNPKYSFRVFLNSLGFKGPEHKTLRADLLANLEGSTAWRHGKPERVVTS